MNLQEGCGTDGFPLRGEHLTEQVHYSMDRTLGTADFQMKHCRKQHSSASSPGSTTVTDTVQVLKGF